jgi:maltooligosyltrehalose trehalohydrolase
MPSPSKRRAGPASERGDSVRFRAWAPYAKRVDLVLLRDGLRHAIPMEAERHGYFAVTVPDVPEGRNYVFSLDGGPDRADPCSLWQPEGVPGPSAIVRPERFGWSDAGWKGVAREDLVLYELHVGTFTPEGTFEAIIARLADLNDLGVTAIELMPVGQFPGSNNWGYDGVLPYAAQNTYGGPHGLAKLVDAAHAAGIAVVLDVVYNHFGPESNYLHEFGPYFTDHYKTPWGRAINFADTDSDPVRAFVLDNVRMWLSEFHLDGLRLDAVHAIYDLGAKHILREIAEVAQDVSRDTGVARHVIAESDQNDPRLTAAPERGGHGLTGQWADDFHHAVHALLTGERRGYYMEFGEPQTLAKTLRTPFLDAGEYSPFRRRRHGAALPADARGDQFVVCIQNHDQVGNRAIGDRLSTILGDPARYRLAASLMLLSPYVPMLFMGEEYGEERPFPFFCSFCGETLIQAVREGRKREFSDFLEAGQTVPQPDATETFQSAKLTWSWPAGSAAAGTRQLYRDLIRARRTWPALRDFVTRSVELLPGDVLQLTRRNETELVAWFNLASETRPLPRSFGNADALFTSEAPRNGGSRLNARLIELLPFECIVIGDGT